MGGLDGEGCSVVALNEAEVGKEEPYVVGWVGWGGVLCVCV